MPNSPEILVDLTDPKAIAASKPLISPALYQEITDRAAALSGVIVELNPQPLPPRWRLVLWNGIVPPDQEWFYQVDPTGISLGIQVSDNLVVPGEHEAHIAPMRSTLQKHAKAVSAAIPTKGGHIFIGIKIDPEAVNRA